MDWNETLKGGCMYEYPLASGKSSRVIAKLIAGDSYLDCRKKAAKWRILNATRLLLSDKNLFKSKALGYDGKEEYILVCPMVIANGGNA